MKQTYSKSAYSEKLKDPRWQKLRLEVMNRSEFHCEICGDGSSTLHVHHKEYFKGREVWEYEIGQLSCICEDCHDAIHGSIDALKLICSYVALDGPGSSDEVAALIAGYIGMPKEKFFELTQLHQSPPTYLAFYDCGASAAELSSTLASKYYQEWRSKQDGEVNG